MPAVPCTPPLSTSPGRPHHPAPNGDPLTERKALGWLPRTCFRTGPPRRIGVELEFLLAGADDALAERHVPEDRRALLVRDLLSLDQPLGITEEPGGQLELSPPPAADVAAAVTDLAARLAVVRDAAARHGLRLVGAGHDPRRSPRRVLTSARYVAMEAYFDRAGGAGRRMMCSTASVQVNVEAARADDPAETGAAVGERRWHLLHAVGPALVAAFANSPLAGGRATGWASARQAVWGALDDRRTRPVESEPGEPLAQAWSRWCLDAPLLAVQRAGAPWTAPAGVTFRDWIRHGERVVPGRAAPGWDDLAYHLTTLFPPVRARGHLEVRYLDAQAGDGWKVPAAVVAALVDDEAAADAAVAAAEPVAGRWADAARDAVRDDDLRRAALGVLDAASRSLAASPPTRALATLVDSFVERCPERARTPGDDLLDEFCGGAR